MSLAVLVGWAARGLVVLLSLLNTRLLIDLVGVKGLAAHSIILSMTVWLALLNLGLPMAVQNLISKYRAAAHEYERLKNTAYSALILIFLIFLPVVWLVAMAVKYWLLSNYGFVEVSTVLAACTLIFISGLGMLFSQILYAEHRGLWPNVYPAINAIGILICLVALKWCDVSNFNIVLIIILLPTLLIACLGAIQLKAFRVWSLDVHLLREIWRSCKGYLLFSTLSACTLAVDYFVMSRLLQAYEIAQYNLLSRVFLTILTVHAVLIATAWSSLSELLHGGRLNEARRKLMRFLQQGLILCALCCGVLVFSIDGIISFLTMGKVSDIHLAVALSWFAYILIRVWCDTFAMGLLCAGQTALINRYVPFQAAISVFSQYYLGREYGLMGIILGLIISFLLTAAWILPREFLKTTKEQS